MVSDLELSPTVQKRLDGVGRDVLIAVVWRLAFGLAAFQTRHGVDNLSRAAQDNIEDALLRVGALGVRT